MRDLLRRIRDSIVDWYRSFRGALSAAHLGIRAIAGDYVEFVYAVVLGSALVVIGVKLELGSAADFAGWSFGLAVAAASVFFIRRTARRKAVLVEILMSHIVDDDDLFLDELLSHLISGGLGNLRVVPTEKLFQLLHRVVAEDRWDFEMKRRVAEALPALSFVDESRQKRETVSLLQELRESWHAPRFHDDLRRRAIEALYLPVPGKESYPKLIQRVSASTAEAILEPHDDDDFFTCMALLEACTEWRPRDKSRRASVVSEVMRHGQLNMESDKVAGLAAQQEILTETSRRGQLALVERSAQSENMYVQVAAARALPKVARLSPTATIRLLRALSQASVHKYVRRPLVREVMMARLVSWCSRSSVRSEAREQLLAFLADPDAIIATTTFDVVEGIRGSPDLMLAACEVVRSRSKSAEQSESEVEMEERLTLRAGRVAARLG